MKPPPPATRRLAILAIMSLSHILACAADWTLTVNSTAANALPSPWQNYFGIHYKTVSTFAPTFTAPSFATVRDYGGAGLGLPYDTNGYGVLQTQLLTGPCATGPFSNSTVCVGLDDLKRWNASAAVTLAQHAPEIITNNLTGIYVTTPFFPAYPPVLNQDLAYWTLRRIHEAQPAAADHLFFQWGNEIFSGHFKPTAPTDPDLTVAEKIPVYAEQYFARGVEAARRASFDVYGDERRIKILSGSFQSIANPAQRLNMSNTMNLTLAGTYAPSLAGRKVWELVDILTVHYPVGNVAVLDEIYNDYLAANKVEAIWITEEHGNKGLGPVSVLNRGLRFIQWAAAHGLTSWQARQCWWGTDQNEPGGKGDVAVNQLGALLSNQTLAHTLINAAPGVDASLLFCRGPEGNLTRIVLAILPLAEQTPFAPFTLGTLTLRLNPGDMASAGAAQAWQYSTNTPPVALTPPAAWDGTNLTITLNRTITDAFLLSVDVVSAPLTIRGALAAGAIHLTITGNPNLPFTLEASTNLSNWTPLQSAVLGNAPFTLTTADPGVLPHRFYRVRAP